MTVEELLENYTEPVFNCRVFVGRAGYAGDHHPYPDVESAIEEFGDRDIQEWCIGWDTGDSDVAIYITVS